MYHGRFFLDWKICKLAQEKVDKELGCSAG
jgi:hypothetical protein